MSLTLYLGTELRLGSKPKSERSRTDWATHPDYVATFH